MSKRIYVARRRPGLSDAAFVARWRRHGALAMSLPIWNGVDHYVQSSVLKPPPVLGASDSYDGIGVTWRRHGGDPDASQIASMAQDELETFAHLIPPFCLLVEEEVLKRGSEARTTAYTFFSDPQSARRFAKTVAHTEADRVILNLVESSEMGHELSYAAVVEASTQDSPSLVRALANLGARPFDGADLALIGRDAILWG